MIPVVLVAAALVLAALWLVDPRVDISIIIDWRMVGVGLAALVLLVLLANPAARRALRRLG